MALDPLDPLQRLTLEQEKNKDRGHFIPQGVSSVVANENAELDEKMGALNRLINKQNQGADGYSPVNELGQTQGSVMPNGVRITQAFGAYNPSVEVFSSSGRNWGTDFGVKEGTPIGLPPGMWQVMETYDRASGKGRIGNKENRGYGNSILVRNVETGETLRFSHLSGVNVIPGKTYQGGTVIGASGATGNVTGAHLDLEYKNPQGQFQDVTKTNYANSLFGAGQGGGSSGYGGGNESGGFNLQDIKNKVGQKFGEIKEGVTDWARAYPEALMMNMPYTPENQKIFNANLGAVLGRNTGDRVLAQGFNNWFFSPLVQVPYNIAESVKPDKTGWERAGHLVNAGFAFTPGVDDAIRAVANGIKGGVANRQDDPIAGFIEGLAGNNIYGLGDAVLGGKPIEDKNMANIVALLNIAEIPLAYVVGAQIRALQGEGAVKTLADNVGDLDLKGTAKTLDNQTLYHGTHKGNKFETFDPSKAGTGVGWNAFDQGDQIYLTSNRGSAEYFANLADNNNQLRLDRTGELPLKDMSSMNQGGEVLEFNLSPTAKIKVLDEMPRGKEEAQELIESLKKEGFDAVQFPDRGFETVEDLTPEMAKKIFQDDKLPDTTIVLNKDKLLTKDQARGVADFNENVLPNFKKTLDVVADNNGLTKYDIEEYKNFKTALSDDGKTGYAIKPDGELVSVFNVGEKGTGSYAVRDAIENSATKLDCFDGKLVEFYKSFGFEETNRVKWDDQYAPDNWDYTKLGRPDIVNMELNKEKYEGLKKFYEKTQKSWDGSTPQTSVPVFETNFRFNGRTDSGLGNNGNRAMAGEVGGTTALGGNTNPQQTPQISANRKKFLKEFSMTSPTEEELNRYYKNAESQSDHFTSILDDLGSSNGGNSSYRLKTKDSLQKKLIRKNSGNNVRAIGDINDVHAGTIVVDDVDSALKMAQEKYGVSNILDNRKTPSFLGYRGVHSDIELPNGQVGEIQFHSLNDLYKKEFAHNVYDKWRRYIESASGSSYGEVLDKVPEALKVEFENDVMLSRKIYNGLVEVPQKYIDFINSSLRL